MSRLLESDLLIFSEPSGARHEARCIAPQPCIRLGPRGIQTMKQTFASGARLRGGRPILPTASKPGRSSGHRHLGSVLTAKRNVVTGRQKTCLLLNLSSCSYSRSQRDTARGFADRHHPPERDQQLSGERHDHRRFTRALSDSRPVPLRQPAIFLEPQRIAKRAGSTHGALGHCPPWQAPFPVALSRFRLEILSSRHTGPPPDDPADCGSAPPEPTCRRSPLRPR